MEIDILFDDAFEDCLDTDWLRRILEATLKYENADDNIEMSLMITGQEKIRRLNKEYRKKLVQKTRHEFYGSHKIITPK